MTAKSDERIREAYSDSDLCDVCGKTVNFGGDEFFTLGISTRDMKTLCGPNCLFNLAEWLVGRLKAFKGEPPVVGWGDKREKL